MHITITPSPLSGVLRVPSSKSMTHRELIAAALAKGETTLSGVTPSQDIEATVRILSLMGAHFTEEAAEDGLTFHISGGLSRRKDGSKPMQESPARHCVSSSRSALFQGMSSAMWGMAASRSAR